jgi:hypothetical protein
MTDLGGGKILELQQQLLIDEPARVRQKPSPVNGFHHVASSQIDTSALRYEYLTLRPGDEGAPEDEVRWRR